MDRGKELARIRTVRSYIPRTYSIILYENWIEVGPTGKRGCPIKGATITVGKAGAGQTAAAGIALGPAGAIVAKMRQRVQVTGANGYGFTVYCFGRDRQELFDFVQLVNAQAAQQERAAAVAPPSPPVAPPPPP